MATARLLCLNTYRQRTIDAVLRVTRTFELREQPPSEVVVERYTALAAKLIGLLSVLPAELIQPDVPARLFALSEIARTAEFPYNGESAPRQARTVTRTIRAVVMRIALYKKPKEGRVGEFVARHILSYARRRLFRDGWACPRMEEALRALARAYNV